MGDMTPSSVNVFEWTGEAGDGDIYNPGNWKLTRATDGPREPGGTPGNGDIVWLPPILPPPTPSAPTGL
jgi:hypothetical protein